MTLKEILERFSGVDDWNNSSPCECGINVTDPDAPNGVTYIPSTAHCPCKLEFREVENFSFEIFEDGHLLTYPEVWQRKLEAIGKKLSINAIGGPCTSYELVASDQTEVVFCGKDLDVLRRMKEIMQTDYYHISLSRDVVGIESAVALKNGFALGIALTIGLNQRAFGLDSELHFNSQAAIFGQSVKEMARLLEYQGAGTLENLSVGLGDLYVTVYGGRTRQIGILLGRGMGIDEAKAELNGVTLESLVVAVRVARAVKAAARRGALRTEDFPLLMHIDEILTDKKAVNIPWESFTFEN
jgi:glycerol-3-phosphate dehydrogenase (NAD(P)+)